MCQARVFGQSQRGEDHVLSPFGGDTIDLIGDGWLPEGHDNARSDAIDLVTARPASRKDRGLGGLCGNYPDLAVMAARPSPVPRWDAAVPRLSTKPSTCPASW